MTSYGMTADSIAKLNSSSLTVRFCLANCVMSLLHLKFAGLETNKRRQQQKVKWICVLSMWMWSSPLQNQHVLMISHDASWCNVPPTSHLKPKAVHNGKWTEWTTMSTRLGSKGAFTDTWISLGLRNMVMGYAEIYSLHLRSLWDSLLHKFGCCGQLCFCETINNIGGEIPQPGLDAEPPIPNPAIVNKEYTRVMLEFVFGIWYNHCIA